MFQHVSNFQALNTYCLHFQHDFYIFTRFDLATLSPLLLPYLWDDDVGQSSRESEQLQSVLQAQSSIVDDIILHTVVNVGYFTDVVAAVLHAEVTLEFGPALQHQLQCLTVVQLQVW